MLTANSLTYTIWLEQIVRMLKVASDCRRPKKGKNLCLPHNIVLKICLKTVGSCRKLSHMGSEKVTELLAFKCWPKSTGCAPATASVPIKLVTFNDGFHRAAWKQDGTDLKREATTAAVSKDKGSFHRR